jgi:acyl-CoA thioesterase II
MTGGRRDRSEDDAKDGPRGGAKGDQKGAEGHSIRPTTTMEELLALVDLEPLEHNIYRGQNRDIGTERVFGGQVLAQALVAARRTVEEAREAHSLHGYFILPGDLQAPIVYFVDPLRDGGSFTTRRVTAIQHGRAIFNLSASFHVEEEGMSHQAQCPEAPPPEEVVPELERIRAAADRIPANVRGVLTQDRPIDFRPVDPPDLFRPDPTPPLRMTWFRVQGEMPDDPLLHQAVLAYASDYGLLATVLQPHGRTVRDRDLQVASLDHALWFHRSFRVDEWLLYVVDSPVAGGSRGFARGSIFTRDGVLVASSAQEGLTRVRDARPG